MKSLLMTVLLSGSVAHTGAFLDVWEVPYVKDHLTITDFGRKLSKVLKWDETNETLREARTTAAKENEVLFEGRGEPLKVARKGYSLSGSKSKSSTR